MKGSPAIKGDNFRKVVALRLGKSEPTIETDNSSHGHYLNPETLDFFVEKEVTKTFFEKAQANKLWTVTMLTDDHKTDAEITSIVSQNMRAWCEEFKANKNKIRPVHGRVTVTETPPQAQASTVNTTETTSPDDNSSSGMQALDLQTPAPSAPTQHPESRDTGAIDIDWDYLIEKQETKGTQTTDHSQVESSDQQISAGLMPMMADLEPEVPEETDSLEAMQRDLDTLIILPLQEAKFVSDIGTFQDRVLAVAKGFASIIQRAKRLING